MNLPDGPADEVVLLTDAAGTGRGTAYRFGDKWWGTVHGVDNVIGPYLNRETAVAQFHAAYDAVTWFPFPDDDGSRRFHESRMASQEPAT